MLIRSAVSLTLLHHSRLAWPLSLGLELMTGYENEQPFRKAVEDEINSLYKVIDDANLTKMDLESQIESMKEELTLLSKTHEEDVKVLYKQLAGSQLEELDVPLGSGLDNILEKIRIHWERDIEKNRAEAGALLRTK
ncbi:hypothetical protein CIB84_015915, partial [Bambusicola thoracicus]